MMFRAVFWVVVPEDSSEQKDKYVVLLSHCNLLQAYLNIIPQLKEANKRMFAEMYFCAQAARVMFADVMHAEALVTNRFLRAVTRRLPSGYIHIDRQTVFPLRHQITTQISPNKFTFRNSD
jgi:hypothetical protein